MAALSFDGVTMSKKNPDLHGNSPDNSTAALLLVDVINDLEFDSDPNRKSLDSELSRR
jgi:hypothetical protein